MIVTRGLCSGSKICLRVIGASSFMEMHIPLFVVVRTSHVLKWKTIETLIERKVKNYELGIKAEVPKFDRLPENKNYGISFFKDGWSRGNEKQVLVAEKFFDTEVLRSFIKSRQDLLEKFI